jgi:putative aminopeptidase FrvX
MRNLYLRRPEKKPGLPLLMLDAHSDEVGFMVRAVRPNGLLEFVALGGWVPYNVPSHKVLVRARDGTWVPGIVASKPPHFLSEAQKKETPDVSDMVIDVGAFSDEEIREDYRITIGAPMVPAVSFEYDSKRDLMTGKAFDDRLGCAAIIAILKELEGAELNVEICAAFASQEEVGLRGATVTAQRVKPDLAISFEGSPADDTLGTSSTIQTALKKGPMLRHYDMRMITNPRFQRYALDLAEKNNIPCQEAVRTGGSTNAGIIHIIGKAVPSIVIGLPVRYIHTHYGIAAYSDFENAVKLGCELIRSLNQEAIKGF